MRYAPLRAPRHRNLFLLRQQSGQSPRRASRRTRARALRDRRAPRKVELSPFSVEISQLRIAGPIAPPSTCSHNAFFVEFGQPYHGFCCFFRRRHKRRPRPKREREEKDKNSEEEMNNKDNHDACYCNTNRQFPISNFQFLISVVCECEQCIHAHF